MAIDKDKVHKTAVSITYARTGKTLHRRERHGVKDFTGTLFITFDETADYEGKIALAYLAELKSTNKISQTILDAAITANNAAEASMQSDITFLQDQIDEIEALLP